MPVSSDFIHDKYAQVSPEKMVNCVAGMTSTTKGYGFGGQRSSRFSEDKKAGGDWGSSSAGVSQTISMSSAGSPPTLRSLSSASSSRQQQQHPAKSPVSAAQLYGSERDPDDLVGPAERARSNPMASQWVASLSAQDRPRPYTSGELTRRRTISNGASIRRPLKIGSQATNFGYPKGPSIIVDEELAASEAARTAARPNTSSFSKGDRTNPSCWVAGRLNKEGPGPVYQTAEDKGYSPQTFGLAVGMQQRFAPGTGSYVTMSSPGLSPGPMRYRPDNSDNLVMPSRATPATFKPRRPAGDMNYLVLRAKNPGAKYNVLGNALETLSTVSSSTKVGFGQSAREQPLSQDFTYMSAPPTSNGQRSPYKPQQIKSTGMHAHNQFTSWVD